MMTMKPLDSEDDIIKYAGYTEVYRKLKVLDKIKEGQVLTHEWKVKGKPVTSFTEDQLDLLAWAQVPFIMSNYHSSDPVEVVSYIKSTYERLKEGLRKSPKVNVV